MRAQYTSFALGGLAPGKKQATKHGLLGLLEPGWGLCTQPNSPIFTPNLIACEVFFCRWGASAGTIYDKLHNLLRVRDTLSKALYWIRLPFYSSSIVEVKGRDNQRPISQGGQGERGHMERTGGD
jgi:hypothetical protein